MAKFLAIPSDATSYSDITRNIHEEITEVDVNITLHYDNFPYRVGDRVVQGSFEKVNLFEFEEVDSLDETDRKGGFGSTGIS